MRQLTQFGTLENLTIGISLQHMMWQVSNLFSINVDQKFPILSI